MLYFSMKCLLFKMIQVFLIDCELLVLHRNNWNQINHINNINFQNINVYPKPYSAGTVEYNDCISREYGVPLHCYYSQVHFDPVW